MFSFVRAAGFAAAAIGLALSPSFADPTLAWELDPAAPTATYIDHAAANIDDAAPQANSVDTNSIRAEQMQPDEPVAEHALATVQEALAQIPADPETPAARPLTALVDEFARGEVADTDMECLAGAIYFESKGEPLAGQLAVAEVIINRAKSGKYPKTLCGVVKQPGQFSFVRGGRLPAVAKDSPHWRKAVAIAHIAVNDLAESPAPQALAFHAARVSPGWKMKRVARVGNHVFYR